MLALVTIPAASNKLCGHADVGSCNWSWRADMNIVECIVFNPGMCFMHELAHYVGYQMLWYFKAA